MGYREKEKMYFWWWIGFGTSEGTAVPRIYLSLQPQSQALESAVLYSLSKFPSFHILLTSSLLLKSLLGKDQISNSLKTNTFNQIQ